MKTLWIFLLLCSLLPAAEKILSYRSHVKVNSDGWLDVTETIKVRVEED